MREKWDERTPFGPEQRPWNEQVPPIARTDGGYLISPPSGDPCQVYSSAAAPGVSCAGLEVPPMALGDAARAEALAQVSNYEALQASRFLGYQTEQTMARLDYAEPLKQYLNTSLNNIGDPFVAGNFTVNTKFAERAVLDYYASLWNAKWPSVRTDPESYWGYVLTMGSTEGNLYAVMQSRDYLQGKAIFDEADLRPDEDPSAGVAARRLVMQKPHAPKDNPNAYTPVAFFSEDTHYSIVKAMNMMEVPTFHDIGTQLYPGQCPITKDGTWPREVPSSPPTGESPLGPGTVDVDKLAALVEFFAARGYPPMIILNYGSTFKCAYDPVEEVGARLLPILKTYGLDERKVCHDDANPQNCDWRSGYWIHVDGALGSSYMPFIEMAKNAGEIEEKGPAFDFRLPFVHSLVMSGHKWPGAPWPTGIFMTKRKYLMQPPDDPEYIGSPDTTFAGSRNGLSPLVLWYYAASRSYEEQMQAALHSEKTAAYAEEQLRKLGDEIGLDLWVQRSPLALTVLFRMPNEQIVFDFSLSTETVRLPRDPSQKRTYAHLFCMWDVDSTLIDRLTARLRAADAFDVEEPVAAAATPPTRPATPGAKSRHLPITGRGWR